MSEFAIGNHTFATKKQAEQYIRQILEENRPTISTTKKIDEKYRQFIDSLLELHPHKEIVLGAGAKAYHCELCNMGAVRFMVERTDGSRWDFSWRNCLNPPTQAKRLTTVLRFEIQDQIDEYKKSRRFPIQCPVSGDIVEQGSCHIDHAEPNTFAKIVENWLRITGYSPDSIELLHKEKYGGRPSIKDRSIAKQWKNYHQFHANLRAVSVRANLSILRKGR